MRAQISMPSFTVPPEAKLAHDQQQAHLRILKWQQLVSDLQLEKVSGAAIRYEPRRGLHDWLHGVRHQIMVRVKGSAAKSFRFFVPSSRKSEFKRELRQAWHLAVEHAKQCVA